jgi:hypothetical protein
MQVTFKGEKPSSFYQQTRRELVAIINEEATRIETELIQATPGDRGGLRRGWQFKPATEKRLVAVVGQSSSYFLPVELGRRPGKGISQRGQEEVAKWALRKKIIQRARGQGGRFIKSKAAASFAYMLSQKYKREGRPAVGFAGLGTPGEVPTSQLPPTFEPNRGPIFEGFERLRSRLR